MSEYDELIRLRKLKRLKELEAIENQQVPEFQSESEIPRFQELGLPFAPKEQAPAPSPQDIALGALDASKTFLSSVPASMIGYPAGVVEGIADEISQGTMFEPGSGQRVEQRAIEKMNYGIAQPSTEVGQDIVETVGEVTAPLVGVTPQLQQLTGPMSHPINTMFRKPKGKQPLTMTPVEAKKVRTEVARRIEAGEVDIDSVIYQLDEGGELIRNPNVKKAIKMFGDDEVKGKHLAILMENMSDRTLSQVRKMLDVIDNGRRLGDEYIMENRPIAVVGESLASRARALHQIKKKASKQMGAAIDGDLRGKSIDTTDLLRQLIDDFSDPQINIPIIRDKKGRLRIDIQDANADLGQGVTKAKLETWLNRLDRGQMDAAEAHGFKRAIRKKLNYDQNNLIGESTDELIANALKRLSSGINEKIKPLSKNYAKANETYQSIADALTSVQKQLKDVDLNSDAAYSKLGHLSKRIGSNLVSRDQVIAMVDELDNALAKNNIRYKDNIRQEVAAVAKLEEIFLTEASQAPWGHTASVGKGMLTANQGPAGVLEFGTDLLHTLKTMNQMDFDAKMKALRVMTRPRGR